MVVFSSPILLEKSWRWVHPRAPQPKPDLMKKFILIVVVGTLGAGCKKTSTASTSERTSLLGKWMLTEYLVDPGDGSGTYQPADPTHPVYIEFKANDSLIMTPANIYADVFEVTSDSTILLGSDSEKYTIRYEFRSALLTLHPRCYEPCGQKYIPVE